MTKTRRAIIFLNGNPVAASRLQAYLADDSLLIGCDGGTRHLLELGLQPRVVIGDFDSFSAPWVPDHLPIGQPRTVDNVTFIRYPTDKNETDGELALRYAKKAGCQDIILVGAIGDRMDHVLGHILLLRRSAFSHLRLKLIDDQQEIYVIRGQAHISGKRGDIISFLPLWGSPKVASSKGLRYDLSQYKLSGYGNIGISNVLLASSAQVTLTRGTLLVVHQCSR